MPSIKSLQHHLLLATVAVSLLLTPATLSLPISSQGTAASPNIAPLPEQPSEISRVEVQDGQDVHRRKRSSCPSEVPSNVTDELRRDVMLKPHPMFFISEMAEMLHQELYSNSILNLGDCTVSQEALDETIKSVSGTILGYLNDSGVPSEDDVGCPPSYAISYHPDRYPRYLVQVECKKKSSKIVPRSEVQCSESPGPSRECEPYHLGDMLYLTTDPPASFLCTKVLDTEWYKCRATSVGVGCKFGDPE